MKRWLLPLILLCALVSLPAYAVSSTSITLLASAAQTASANGATVDVSGIKELTVYVNVTAGSGTLSAFSVYLESSDDGGTTWYEILADEILKTTGTAAEPTPTIQKRNIVTEAAIVTSAKYAATFTNFGNKVRVHWLITPTSAPSETFSVKAVGKN